MPYRTITLNRGVQEGASAMPSGFPLEAGLHTGKVYLAPFGTKL